MEQEIWAFFPDLKWDKGNNVDSEDDSEEGYYDIDGRNIPSPVYEQVIYANTNFVETMNEDKTYKYIYEKDQMKNLRFTNKGPFKKIFGNQLQQYEAIESHYLNTKKQLLLFNGQKFKIAYIDPEHWVKPKSQEEIHIKKSSAPTKRQRASGDFECAKCKVWGNAENIFVSKNDTNTQVCTSCFEHCDKLDMNKWEHPKPRRQRAWEKLSLPLKLSHARYKTIGKEIHAYKNYASELEVLKEKYEREHLTFDELFKLYNLVPMTNEQKKNFTIPFIDAYEDVMPGREVINENYTYNARNYTLEHMFEIVEEQYLKEDYEDDNDKTSSFETWVSNHGYKQNNSVNELEYYYKLREDIDIYITDETFYNFLGCKNTGYDVVKYYLVHSYSEKKWYMYRLSYNTDNKTILACETYQYYYQSWREVCTDVTDKIPKKIK